MIAGLEVDVDATRSIYRTLPEVDVNCCYDCAVFAEAVKTDALPQAFVAELRDIGIDALRPVEVWALLTVAS